MKSILMMKTAQMIVNNSARINRGENVCIVGDTNTFPIAKVLAGASYATGAETVLTIMILNPTVEIDGQLIVKKGMLLPLE